MFVVRPYTRADYDDFARIGEATQSTAYWGESDWHTIHPPCAETPGVSRYVAVDPESSQTVGYGAVVLAQNSNLDVMVHPDWQRRGVGRALWEQMREDLSVHSEPSSVTVGPWVRAANVSARRWLESVGFEQVHQDGAVQLFVADADLQAFPSAEDALAEQGIVITTLADEKKRSPDCLISFYDLFREVEKDVPGYSPESGTSFEGCLKELTRPGMTWDGVFIARRDSLNGKAGEFVGLTILRQKITEQDLRFAGPGSLAQHLTGVHRDYRRRGIALALKRRTIAYARANAYECILSNSDNPAMRALNQKLGFRTGPWLIYQHTLGYNMPK